jgi:hypothetical protein
MIPGLDLYNQFILWRPEKTPEGKINKIPCDTSGWPINPHNPAAWNSAAIAGQAAASAAAHLNMGIGFVFTENDPFFFLDIDHAWNGSGEWSELARAMFDRFKGCAIERSQSGAGAHIFGIGRPPEGAKKKNTAAGVELYYQGRFVALTGHGLEGSALTDAQAAVDATVAEFFASEPAAGGGVEILPADWNRGPDPDWRGPEDDQALIARMTARISAAAAFGQVASPAELWRADAAALGRAYPHPSRPYDASGADLALACHLAYWTGRDPARMERIFNLSALARDKWRDRPDYRVMTILKACNLTQSTAGSGFWAAPTDPPAPAAGAITAPAGDAGPAGSLPATHRAGAQILTLREQENLFRGCVYIREAHRVYTPDGSLLRPDQFRAAFGGYTFVMDALNDRTSRNAWEAFTENQGIFFPRVHNLCFRPERTPGEILHEEGRDLINIYTPIETPATPGDPAPFLDHLARILPEARDREILIAYLAALVQFPGVKFQWAPLIQGMEGNGKSLIIRAMAEAIGHRYTHLPNAADIHNKFNAWIEGRLFIGVEEVYTQERQEALESLKPLITNDRVEVQGKGLDQRTGDNRANFILCSNHKDAIRKTATDRRYCVFYTAQQRAGDLERHGLTGAYFPRLYAWLKGGGFAIVTHYLRTYQIPDALNPAGMAHRAPATSSTDEALAMGLGGLEQEILEAVEEGRAGFRGGWISSAALDRLLEDRRSGIRRISHSKRRDLLAGLGYCPHPGLPDGRAAVPVTAEGNSRPRLFIRSGSDLAAEIDPTWAYQIAQGYPTF